MSTCNEKGTHWALLVWTWKNVCVPLSSAGRSVRFQSGRRNKSLRSLGLTHLLTISPVLCESKKAMSWLMTFSNSCFLIRAATLSPTADNRVMYTKVNAPWKEHKPHKDTLQNICRKSVDRSIQRPNVCSLSLSLSLWHHYWIETQARQRNNTWIPNTETNFMAGCLISSLKFPAASEVYRATTFATSPNNIGICMFTMATANAV